jgi:hypothetical protein
MRRSSFFEGISQAELSVAGHDVRLPIFYYDGRAVTALFPARLGALKRLMPTRRFVPARLAPGVGVVGVTAFEYTDTDIGPYNELAISVVLHDPPYLPNLPGLAMTRMLRRSQLHAYVHHLPVTTEIARVGGRAFYNYPKFVADIEFSARTAERLRCELSENGRPILTLEADPVAANDELELQIFSNLWMDRQPQSAEFKLHAVRSGRTSRFGAARVKPAPGHPIGRELDGLLLSRRALQVQHLECFEGILYGPEHLSLPFLAQLQEANAGDRLGAPVA